MAAVHRSMRVVPRRTLTPLAALAALAALAPPAHAAGALELGGNLALTSDYLYRGVSATNGHAALQGDLHADTADGIFFGIWASTRDRDLDPGASYELQPYVGVHFDLGGAWGAGLAARAHYLPTGGDESEDYEEISATLAWSDLWTFSVSAIPNSVRYWFYVQVPRSPAWAADTTVQWLVFPGWFLTGGAGYYYASGTGRGIQRSSGYAYGNAGAAFVRGRWRIDAGVFFAQDAALRSFPYPVAKGRLAATLSWHF